MTELTENTPASDRDRLSLRYEGGLSDSGALLLDEYAASLDGWRELFEMLAELYFHSFPELRRIRGADLTRIEIVAEKRGSYEVVLYFVLGAVAGGIIGNRADAAVVWSFHKLVEWFRAAITRYVRTKNETTDVNAIAEALRQMMEQQGISLQHEESAIEPAALFPSERDGESDWDEIEAPPAPADRGQAFAEKLDQSLKHATRPLEKSCERIKVLLPDKLPMLEIGPPERAIISAPLTLPPPSRDWRAARVKFVRINRETGRALFHFEGEDPRAHGANYSRITDPAVRSPHNLYSRAFYDDEFIEVWIRQARAERGRLNLQWEITAKNPNQGTLFDLPPPR